MPQTAKYLAGFPVDFGVSTITNHLNNAKKNQYFYIRTIIEGDWQPSRAILEQAKTIIESGRVLMDDGAGVVEWAKAFRRLTGQYVADLRIEQFREGICAQVE